MKEITALDWERFCQLVKHERRYFFHNTRIKESPFLYGLSVIEEIANQLCYSSVQLKIGTEFYRCRPDPSKFESTDYYKELGPPPPASARANRMSAAGISMLYLAESQKTSLLETADRNGNFGIAKFKLNREITLLDLSDFSKIENKKIVLFLNKVVTDMTKPIERDNRVHIDYIPTQIFTEQFSHNWSDDKNRKIEGLRFPSARNNGESNYVFFYNQTRFLSHESPFELIDYNELEYKIQ